MATKKQPGPKRSGALASKKAKPARKAVESAEPSWWKGPGDWAAVEEWRRQAAEKFARGEEYLPPEVLAVIEERRKWFEAFMVDPNTRGWLRLFELYGDAKHDPVVALSPAAKEFAERIQRRVGDSIEHLRAQQTFKAMQSEMGTADGATGGRPPTLMQWETWSARYEELKRTRPTAKTARDRYDDIVAEWNEHHEPVKWTAIRDGISELKRRKKAAN